LSTIDSRGGFWPQWLHETKHSQSAHWSDHRICRNQPDPKGSRYRIFLLLHRLVDLADHCRRNRLHDQRRSRSLEFRLAPARVLVVGEPAGLDSAMVQQHLCRRCGDNRIRPPVHIQSTTPRGFPGTGTCGPGPKFLSERTGSGIPRKSWTKPLFHQLHLQKGRYGLSELHRSLLRSGDQEFRRQSGWIDIVRPVRWPDGRFPRCQNRPRYHSGCFGGVWWHRYPFPQQCPGSDTGNPTVRWCGEQGHRSVGPFGSHGHSPLSRGVRWRRHQIAWPANSPSTW